MKVRIIDTTNQYLDLSRELVEERGGEVVSGRDFDVLLAFLVSESTATGFLVAEAAERQRYVLALTPEDSEGEPGVREGSKFLTLKKYNEQNIAKILKEYLDHRKRGNLKRFNFVIPSELVDYLEWVPKSKGTSKSDFVRDLIQQELNSDEKYNQLNQNE